MKLVCHEELKHEWAQGQSNTFDAQDREHAFPETRAAIEHDRCLGAVQLDARDHKERDA